VNMIFTNERVNNNSLGGNADGAVGRAGRQAAVIDEQSAYHRKDSQRVLRLSSSCSVIDENQCRTDGESLGRPGTHDIPTSAAPIENDIHQASFNGESVSRVVTAAEAHTE
jgi:hypothetical protein